MPALKQLLRRTIATATIPPPSILSPPLTPTATRTRTVVSVVSYMGGGGGKRSTLGKGCARLRVGGAHIKGPKIKQIIMGVKEGKNINSKRVYMLSSSSSSCSSSSSSPFSSSSSSFEERESGDKLDTLSSPSAAAAAAAAASASASAASPASSDLVPGMGDEGKDKFNDVDWHRNEVVPLNKDQQEKEKEQEKCSKLLTLPTVLTLARVAAIPVFIATFYANSWWGAAATTSIFVAAAITDWLDGYLARKMCLGTAFGAFLDPVADKLMVAATLVLLCSRPPEMAIFGDIPWLFPVPAIIIIGREITMSAVREWAASQDAKLLQAVAVNNLGKWKTATQMTALTFILATRDSSIASQGAVAASGVALLYISAGLAAWSLVVYMRKIWKVLLR